MGHGKIHSFQLFPIGKRIFPGSLCQISDLSHGLFYHLLLHLMMHTLQVIKHMAIGRIGNPRLSCFHSIYLDHTGDIYRPYLTDNILKAGAADILDKKVRDDKFRLGQPALSLIHI